MPFLLLLSLPSVYLSQPPMALAQLPRSLWQGTLCLCGINRCGFSHRQVSACTEGHRGDAASSCQGGLTVSCVGLSVDSQPSDNCRWAPVVFVVHIFVTVMVIIP